MKKAKLLILLALISIIYSSCATVFGGPITSCQRERHDRQIRPAALVLDIFFCPIVCLPVDFATHAIYKPCEGVKRSEERAKAREAKINGAKKDKPTNYDN